MTSPAPARELPQLAVPCPTCHATPGDLCTSHSGTRPRRNDTHVTRTAAWLGATRTAAWLGAEPRDLGLDLNQVNLTPPPERTFVEQIETPGVDALLDETRPAQSQYRVTYERVGRRRDVPPLTTVAAGADHLAELIHADARPYLLSSDVEVFVDLEAMTGHILCGFNSGGRFAIEVLDGPPAQPTLNLLQEQA